MTDDAAPVEAQYDASRVMFNGAAIALVTNLTNGIRESLTAEIKAAEERQTVRSETDRAEQRDSERRLNERIDQVAAVLTGDVDALENWKRDVDDARLIRQGQMSVLQAISSFLLRYDKLILSAVVGAAIGVAAALFGHPS